MLETGDFIYFPASWSIQSRVSSSKHIAYVHLPIIINDDAINQKMYFKTKFGASLVSKINAICSEKKLSTGTTYCCYWNVYYHRDTLEVNQKFGKVPSPNCALQPETRSSYTDRGYQKTEKEQNDGTTLVEMYSFELYILYDEKKLPKRLDIYYPKIIGGVPNGYEFIYNILTL